MPLSSGGPVLDLDPGKNSDKQSQLRRRMNLLWRMPLSKPWARLDLDLDQNLLAYLWPDSNSRAARKTASHVVQALCKMALST